ncbi:MAG: SIMPL domain-containing protein [Candidatus Marinimicrobia bacterium]|nr:SIMPL domain-containing protein [Candidatus Neomarinimicrobiota bacterium]
MRKYTIFLIVIISLLYSSDNSNKEIVRDLFHVEGTILSEVPADFASFQFTISGTGKDLRSAVDKAKGKVKEISSSLFNIGLDKSNLSTSRFFSGENIGGKAFLTDDRDYVASIRVVVNTDNLDLLEPAILVVSDQDLDELTDITFKLKNIEKVKYETFEKAILKAKEKAIAFQQILDIGKIRVVKVEEMNNYRNRNLVNPFNSSNAVHFTQKNSVGMDESGNIPMFYAETISVSVKVQVTYEILQE